MRDKKDDATCELPGFEAAVSLTDAPANAPANSSANSSDNTLANSPANSPANAPSNSPASSTVKAPRNSIARQRKPAVKQQQLELLDATDASGLPAWRRDENTDLTGLPIWAAA